MTRIRPLAAADIDQVAALHVRTWQVGYAGIVPEDYLAALDPAARAEGWRAQLKAPGVVTLVAATDRIVGFATYGPFREDDDGAGELYAIYVSPDHWGHGVGRELLTAAKKGLTEAGYPSMRLWVLTDNTNARRFYERMGLTADGVAQTWTPRGTAVELPELRYSTPL
jgi:ribosomal protein S18 acetylase RimI-like enzyme